MQSAYQRKKRFADRSETEHSERPRPALPGPNQSKERGRNLLKSPRLSGAWEKEQKKKRHLRLASMHVGGLSESLPSGKKGLFVPEENLSHYRFEKKKDVTVTRHVQVDSDVTVKNRQLGIEKTRPRKSRLAGRTRQVAIKAQPEDTREEKRGSVGC